MIQGVSCQLAEPPNLTAILQPPRTIFLKCHFSRVVDTPRSKISMAPVSLGKKSLSPSYPLSQLPSPALFLLLLAWTCSFLPTQLFPFPTELLSAPLPAPQSSSPLRSKKPS